MAYQRCKTMKERHKIPHFTLHGGIWHCFREFDDGGGYPNNFPAKHAHLYFDHHSLQRLLESYRWWRNKDPKNARITDAMLIRYCSAYRFWDVDGKKRFAYAGSSEVFTKNRRSRHAGEYMAYLRRRIVPKPGRKTKITPEMIPALIDSGYCRVSSSHRRVARIDRESWRDILALRHSHHDPAGEGMARAYDSRAGDTYRRCHSNDVLTIDEPYLFKMFPGSGDGPDYYLPLCEAEKQ